MGTGDLFEGEAEAFGRLVHETIVITRGEGRAFAVGPSPGAETVKKVASEVTGA